MKKPKIKTLENGLRVLMVPSESQSVMVQVLVNTGAQYETAQNNGISHFLEHMCFKGTTSRSGKEMMHFLDGLGCQTNAFTDEEITGYYIKSAKKHWKKTLAVVADIFQNPLFPVDEIEREKGVIIGEINMYADDPSSVTMDEFDALLYGDQPAGHTILGTPENIKNMTQDDFEEYHRSHYSANNSLVVVSGNLKTAEVITAIEKEFSQLGATKKIKKAKTKIKQDSARALVVPKKTEQSHLVIGYPTVPMGHKDSMALTMLSVLLGGGMSSRLFEKVREELGAGYYVYASQFAYTDSGSLRVVAGIDSDRLVEVVSEIHGVLEDVVQNAISEKELKKIREYISGNFIMGLESANAQAQFYAKQIMFDLEDLTPRQFLQKMRHVTALDIRRVARKYLKSNKVNIVTVGPHEDKIKQGLLSVFEK